MLNAAVSASSGENISPYRTFSRSEWRNLRAETPLTLSEDEIGRLRSLNDRMSTEEVSDIYLPLSRLLSLYVEATQGLFDATKTFLMADGERKTPYIIGIAGSVAVGKSTTARLLQALLARWPNTPKVALVTTDGFLMSNADLQRQNLMERKGFPESYNTKRLLKFLHDIKAGKPAVAAPVYSHLVYDVMPSETVLVEKPDILILEGLNVLQIGETPSEQKEVSFVSDYFDFSIYLDADEDHLRRWYIDRFLSLRETAFRDPLSYFRKYAEVSETEAVEVAEGLWSRINLVNLRENIAPTKQRAGLMMRKGFDHRIEHVALRRL